MRPLGLLATLSVYGAFGLMLLAGTAWGMPALQARGIRPDISWFIVAGVVFAAFGLATLILLALEGRETRREWHRRLRIKPMSGEDWRTALAGIAFMLIGSGAAFLAFKALDPDFSPHPPFLQITPLQSTEYWVLLAWLPMFALNIGCEEIFGRGYLLPRNELAAGRYGWLVNACGWLLFHMAFGWQLMIVTAPVILAVCWAVQRRRNTTIGLVIHGLANGPSFIAISLGLMPA
ncbi:CPBP family intramembrane glutamic endopeptidase [Microvirga splendida]|uniref:CPBP family intramembrane metalloprotease n=1 Tax=Microvirga splendida TaxID=2795727 RepID=A0ABS0XYM1_9HYPH|nr:CPBP family intramembrane glutamic endopeptidase [Microvirga splendida]MBJ6125157.1 CPBP family intramembrane metalloprotease [Microvirga splendida]